MAELIANVGDVVTIWVGHDRFVIIAKPDHLHVSRWDEMVIIPAGSNVIRLPFETRTAQQLAGTAPDSPAGGQ